MYTVYTVYTHLHHLPVSKVMDIGKLLQPRRGMLLSPGFRGGRQIAWWIGAGLEPVHCPLHGSLSALPPENFRTRGNVRHHIVFHHDKR